MLTTKLRLLSCITCIIAPAALLWGAPLRAATFPSAEGYIGTVQRYKVQKNESLIEIARRFDLGFNEIADANPALDPFIPPYGTVITVPTSWILPVVSLRPSIVINIPELRLYFITGGRQSKIHTFPLGVGDEGSDTPAGNYTVIEKVANPSWHVPKSIRAERRDLPEVMPPGPRNPMGTHALRLSRKSILIHGTNRPWGIGRRSSHGCLRLYPEDIKRLFRLVPKGTRVIILDRPLKVAQRGDEVFVEVHRYRGKVPNVAEALRLLAGRKLLGRTDFAKVIRAVEEHRGYPVDVTLRPPLHPRPGSSGSFTRGKSETGSRHSGSESPLRLHPVLPLF